MKQQKMIWDHLSEEKNLVWLEQGQYQQIGVSAGLTGKPAQKRKAVVLLPPSAAEARLLRLPQADVRQTRQMLAMALQTAPAEAVCYKWRAVRQEAEEQWLFAVTYSAADLQTVQQQAAEAGIAVKETIGIYEALLSVWQQLSAELKQAAETVLLYHAGEQMTLLFMQNGQPIHGQTMNRTQSAEEMALAYKRTVNALVRQELWHQTQTVLYLEEGAEAELFARQLAVLAETEVLLLNEQPPFSQWQSEEAPLLVRSLLESLEKNSLLENWQQSTVINRQKGSRALWGCIVLIALTGAIWLGSAIWLQQVQKQTAGQPAIVQQASAERRESAYGQVLEHIDAIKGKTVLQEIKLEAKGLVIYASAPDWSEAAAFGERLEGLSEISTMTITRSEKLLRLRDGQPETFIALTIAVSLEGGVPDEG